MADEVNFEAPHAKVKRRKGEGSRPAPNFRWKPMQTRSLLEFVVSLVKEGSRSNKYAAGAKFISTMYRVPVSEANVHNHLRGWRAKWMRILLLKNMSGVGWDEDQKMVVMGDEEAHTYLEAHPKDEGFINKPIEYHDEMATIFGDDVAQGKYARGDQDTLGGGSSYGVEDDVYGCDDDELITLGAQNTTDFSPSESKRSRGTNSMSISNVGASSSAGKRNRKGKAQEALTVLAASFEGISRVLVQTKDEEVDRESRLLDELLKLVGMEYYYHTFTQDHVSTAYDFLLEHGNIAKGFLKRSEEGRMIWLSQFLTLNGL